MDDQKSPQELSPSVKAVVIEAGNLAKVAGTLKPSDEGEAACKNVIVKNYDLLDHVKAAGIPDALSQALGKPSHVTVDPIDLAALNKAQAAIGTSLKENCGFNLRQ